MSREIVLWLTVVGAGDVALRFARFEALAGLFLLVLGQFRVAAEFDPPWPWRRPGRALCALVCGGAPRSPRTMLLVCFHEGTQRQHSCGLDGRAPAALNHSSASVSIRRWIEDLPRGVITMRALSQKPASSESTGASPRVSVSPRSCISRSSSKKYFLVSFLPSSSTLQALMIRQVDPRHV
jgi:hypothetical protein